MFFLKFTGEFFIIEIYYNIRITRTPARGAPATAGDSCPVAAGTPGDWLRDHDISFPFAGRAGHTTDLPVTPAIGATFLISSGYLHCHLYYRALK